MNIDFIYSLLGNAEGHIDKTALWTAALVIVTFILLLVAIFQLSNIKKTARADYIKRLNDSFFTEETRNLLVLLFNSAIEFSNLSIKDKEGKTNIDELPYFKIKAFVLEQLKNNGLISLAEWRKGYNAFEIDDLLLGHFDDVGRFEKKGLLDIHTAYSTFGYYVLELIGKNEEVKKYLKDRGCQGNYDDLEYIYKEFVSYKNIRKECWCVRQCWSIRHRLFRRLARRTIEQNSSNSDSVQPPVSGLYRERINMTARVGIATIFLTMALVSMAGGITSLVNNSIPVPYVTWFFVLFFIMLRMKWYLDDLKDFKAARNLKLGILIGMFSWFFLGSFGKQHR